MRIVAMDVGGSGVKSAEFEADGRGGLHMVGSVTHHRNPDWKHFARWLGETFHGFTQPGLIGLACAGFVESAAGVVRLCRIAGWRDNPIKRDIEIAFPGSTVFLLNDAGAHLVAHGKLYQHPQICISLGTSLGFATSDAYGGIIRPPDGMNFDLGAISIPSRATNRQVWWALGSRGLEELQENMGKENGTRHFRGRVGAFLAAMCSIFRPRTVVISGGIADANWNLLEEALLHEFRNATPDWLPLPNVARSPFGAAAALHGIARHVEGEWRKRARA